MVSPGGGGVGGPRRSGPGRGYSRESFHEPHGAATRDEGARVGHGGAGRAGHGRFRRAGEIRDRGRRWTVAGRSRSADVEFMPDPEPGMLSIRAGGAPEYVLKVSRGWFQELVHVVATAEVNKDLFRS